MTVKLTIRWDGDVPGLSDHKLSLNSWLKPMDLLLAALRRTASGIVTEAIADPEYGTHGGRIHRLARQLDLNLISIGRGCVALELEIDAPPPPGQQDLLYEQLPRRAAVRVIDALAAEARGEPTSAPVRKLLQSLPDGLHVQEYTVTDGDFVHPVVVRETAVVEASPPLPGLVRVQGHVVAVGFEPGNSSVTIKGGSGRSNSFPATDEQVEQALLLRGREVTVVGTLNPGKLVWIRAADDDEELPSDEERLNQFCRKWDRTLEILSR